MAAFALSLTIDRDSAARLGISSQVIDDTLYDAFGQRQISTIFTQLNQYRVILEATPELQQNPRALERIFVRSATGDQVPLSAFARFDQENAPLVVSHQGQFPAVTLSFNLAHGGSLGAAVDAITKAQASIGMPPSVRADFAGTARAFGESLSSAPVLLLAAVITVYIVLGVLYESYIHPITILSSLPSAGVGALLALMVCGEEFSVIALIGIVLLIGIVKKNAIMMIDFALEAAREEHLDPETAIHKGLFVALSADHDDDARRVARRCPLAFGTGTGSELRAPARHRDRGRPFDLAGAHAVHDAGRLPLHGAVRGLLAAPPARPRGAGRGPMNFSAPFIRRSVATTLLSLAVVLAGHVGVHALARLAPCRASSSRAST